MPGMYSEEDYDLAGFAVGIAEKSRLITGASIEPGHFLIGLPASGIHSNGYSLVRKIFFEQQRFSNGREVAGIRRKNSRRRIVNTNENLRIRCTAVT